MLTRLLHSFFALLLLAVGAPAAGIDDTAPTLDIVPPVSKAGVEAPFLEMVGDAPRPGISQYSDRRGNSTDLTEIITPDTDWLDVVTPDERRTHLHVQLLTAHEQELVFEFEEAARGFATLATEVESSAYPAWRASRAWWRASDLVPETDYETRGEYLDEADRWAQVGIDRDPGCAECMLWRYAALGRLATVRGIMSAARNARTMKKLLNRGIELNPTRTEGENNSTLGNLYYASAVFNRMVPESIWLRMLFGVSGDKKRAVRDARHAVALHPNRVDYQVELGAVLLCHGMKDEKDTAIVEGRGVLASAKNLERILPTDGLDLEFARIMSEKPELACSFSRDGFVDVEKAAKTF